MARLLISAAHKSSGKTIVSTGLCAALRARGLRVQPFKKGPDYIDPLWLGRAAGRPCVNLDFHTMSHEEIRRTVGARAAQVDLSLIEANKGLHDGVDLHGANSNAALARLLDTPVVLVIDSRGMTRGVAPLLLGYQAFDRSIQIAGVIFNRVGGSRHGAKLRAVVEAYTDIPVLGAIGENPALHILERHLGLVPSNEHAAADAQIHVLGAAIGTEVDLERIATLGTDRPPLPVPAPDPPRDAPPVSAEGVSAESVSAKPVSAGSVSSASVSSASVAAGPDSAASAAAGSPGPRPRIAVARDAAFGFYYATDLEALEHAGADLVFFDTLRDRDLPRTDGLFIGGGFPESQMQALEANGAMRAAIRDAIEAGLPAYAECGGLMYLARSIRWGERHGAMAGVLPGEIVMHERPQGRGYVQLEETGHGPWPLLDTAGRPGRFGAHEFHYSALEPLQRPPVYAYRVLRGHGIDGHHDGIVHRNLLASYSHLRATTENPWAARFVDFVRSVAATRAAPAGSPSKPRLHV